MPTAEIRKPQMQGRITKYLAKHDVGVIHAANGRAFRFTGRDIINGADLELGAEVDFLVASAARPVEIFVLAGTPFSAFAGHV